MSRIRLCLGLLLLVAVPAAAEELRTPSTISSVVVYPLGATVVRTVAVDLPAGATVVVIDGLPLVMEADSLKVEGSATGGIAIASVETRYVPAGETTDPERQRLLDLIRNTEDRIATLDDRIGALDGQRRFLERLIDATPEGFGAALSEGIGAIDQWATAAATIGDGLAKVARDTQAARIEQRALSEAIAEQRKALAELPEPRDSIAVRVALTADEPASGTLMVSYRTPAASWVPTYDAQLATGEDGEKPSLTIVRRAEVTQATGEDWADVAMTLSTIRTTGGTVAPFLPANLVAIFDGYEYGSEIGESATVTTRPMPAPSLDGDLADVLAGAQEEAAKYIEAAADFGDFRAEYVVPGRVSVDSGKGARSMRIATEQVVARIEVRAVPMLSDAAYLHAAFVPPDGAPMLAGRVALFRDGSFVGNGDLPFGRAGRELNLGFGIDDRVRVTRVVLDRETGQHGLITSRKTDTRRFKVTVDNLHSQPVEIAVYDRIPYAEDENVNVTRLGDMTEPTVVNVDDRRGVLAWTYTYEPGETREILNGYEVSWPADKQLVSLD
jgi:uncharacterized protein (TIGR02231 family)